MKVNGENMPVSEARELFLSLALEYCAIADRWENGPAATGRLEDSERHRAFTATEHTLRAMGRRMMRHYGPGPARLVERSMERGESYVPDDE